MQRIMNAQIFSDDIPENTFLTYLEPHKGRVRLKICAHGDDTIDSQGFLFLGRSN